jgi:hypothetical protein
MKVGMTQGGVLQETVTNGHKGKRAGGSDTTEAELVMSGPLAREAKTASGSCWMMRGTG